MVTLIFNAMKKSVLISITVYIITMVVLSIMYWPLAIEGFWVSPVQVWGSAVSFYLFKDGKVLHYVEGDECMAWFADYKKIGFEKYRITYHSSGKKDDIVVSRLFNSKIHINDIENTVRKAIESAGFEYNVHINQEWVIDHSSPYLKVCYYK